MPKFKGRNGAIDIPSLFSAQLRPPTWMVCLRFPTRWNEEVSKKLHFYTMTLSNFQRSITVSRNGQKFDCSTPSKFRGLTKIDWPFFVWSEGFCIYRPSFLELLINLFVGRCFFEMLGLLFVSDGVSVRLHNINMTSKGLYVMICSWIMKNPSSWLVYLTPPPNRLPQKIRIFLNIGFP